MSVARLGGRGAYGERVRRYFWNPAHAGEAPPGRKVHAAEGREGGAAGARVRLMAVTEQGTLAALRYRIFGCPHLIAAAEAVCERFEGRPVQMLAELDVPELMRWLDVPVEKTGRILLLEDAVRSLLDEIGSAGTGGN